MKSTCAHMSSKLDSINDSSLRPYRTLLIDYQLLSQLRSIFKQVQQASRISSLKIVKHPRNSFVL